MEPVCSRSRLLKACSGLLISELGRMPAERGMLVRGAISCARFQMLPLWIGKDHVGSSLR